MSEECKYNTQEEEQQQLENMDCEESNNRSAPLVITPRDATWNFVQMNMSLLPIARPLPVSTATRLGQEGVVAFTAGKPRTPNQKLHTRVLQNASNISPRHNEFVSLQRKSTVPMPSLAEDGSKLSDDFSNEQVVRSVSTVSLIEALSASRPKRLRSASEEFTCREITTSCDVGYLSDTSHEDESKRSMVMHRNLGQLSGGRTFKGKRILELQDEERRLHPDGSLAIIASKRCRFI
jgi:hypothetical protein